MFKKKFRKSMTVSFILIPIMLFSIGIPLFYFSYTTKDLNNTKKILQEAAYAGALAGSYAIDIRNFELEKEHGRDSISVYPTDNDTGNPVAFMKQSTAKVRKGLPLSTTDCLNGKISENYPTGKSTDIASTEVVQAVEEYLKDNLNMSSTASNKPSYTTKDYSISMLFERDGINYIGGSSTDKNYKGAPYNRVTVSVSLNYKPIIYKSLLGNVPIQGTSSAKTKTIQ